MKPDFLGEPEGYFRLVVTFFMRRRLERARGIDKCTVCLQVDESQKKKTKKKHTS